MEVPRSRRPRRKRCLLRSSEYRVPDKGLSILDYLNEDCWRAMLDYVPILDIIRSEPVSQRWQGVVLNYLSNVRISIIFLYSRHHMKQHNISFRREIQGSSFRSWTKKLGNSVVTFDCETLEALESVKENCPNIEDFKLILGPQYEPPSPDGPWKVAAPPPTYHNFQRLRRLCFYSCSSMRDASVGEYLASDNLEELKILVNRKITGLCLINLKSNNLKSLVLKRCTSLQFSPLMSVADRLSGLTKLVLKDVPDEVGDNVHHLLDKTPKLEYLLVRHPDVHLAGECEPFFEAVCRLRSLKFLSAGHCGTGAHVENVVRCCENLQYLSLEKCIAVVGRTLAAVRRAAGTRLSALSVRAGTSLQDDLVDYVQTCPNIQFMSLPQLWMSVELALRLAAARRVHCPAANAATAARLHIRLHNDRDDLYILEMDRRRDRYEDVLLFSRRDYNNDYDSDDIGE